MGNVRSLLLRVLDIRSEDLRRTLLMQAYLFIIISVLLFLKPVSNSIFLSQFGIEQIPYVFIAVAITAFFFTKFYSKLQRNFSFIRLHRLILLGIAVSLLLFFVGIQIEAISGFIIYAFYIWVAIFALVATSQFWIFGNILFNPREARRVFGIIGAGGIAGGVFGGYMTSIIVPYIGNSGLILLSAIFISLCFPLVNNLWKENHGGVSDDSLVVKKRRKIAQNFSFRRLYKSRHLILLASLTGTAVFVSKLVDFQFQGIAASEFTEPEALTSFFGFWFSTFNVIGLIIQLFLTSRMLKFLGVGKSQYILPGSFIITGILLFFFPVLWCAILLKGADGTFKQSIQRSVNELLMLPIPREIKEQSKTFIDVFVDSFATGLSGLILIFLLSSSDITSTYVSLIIVTLSIVWLVLAYIMRKEYFISFKKQFLNPHAEAEPLVSRKNTFYENLETLLEAKNEEELLRVLGNLEKLPEGLNYSKTLSLLGHRNPDVRLKALQLRPFPNKKFKPQILELLVNDPELKIRVEAYLYLLERESNISEGELLEELKRSEGSDDAALLFASCIYFRNSRRLKEKFDLERQLAIKAQEVLVDRSGQFNKDHKYFALRAIAHGRFSSLYKFIDLYLDSNLVEHKKIALLVSSFTLSKKYAHILISYLHNDMYRETAAQALKYYGESLLVIGSEIMKNAEISNDAKAKFVQILSTMGTQNAANYLTELLNHKSFKIRRQALSQLNLMKSRYPRLDYRKDRIYKRIKKEVKMIKALFSIQHTLNSNFKKGPENLNDLFYKRKMKVLSRLRLLIRKRLVSVFLLLGLEYEKKDIFDIYTGLLSDDEIKRTYSLEFLEMMIDYKYGKMLGPILEASFKKHLTDQDYSKLQLKTYDAQTALAKLFRYPDAKMQNRILNLFSHDELIDFKGVLDYSGRNMNPMLKKKLQDTKSQVLKRDNKAS
ncbi:NTP/NDP exchange transporter [Portibacter marinus]|uniref:NTP/NDP exchange transporter n=1 Tax=Portibacter marinus TaxID=2898660 RepID=UPI001F1C4752|nr:hypothetical protein [Portibacter marinus]